MTPEEMLDQLNEAGSDAFADYNDEVDGWFGWDIVETSNAASRDVIRCTLTITFKQDGQPDVTHSWLLQPADRQP